LCSVVGHHPRVYVVVIHAALVDGDRIEAQQRMRPAREYP
jgi:hypothetical protein